MRCDHLPFIYVDCSYMCKLLSSTRCYLDLFVYRNQSKALGLEYFYLYLSEYVGSWVPRSHQGVDPTRKSLDRKHFACASLLWPESQIPSSSVRSSHQLHWLSRFRARVTAHYYRNEPSCEFYQRRHWLHSFGIAWFADACASWGGCQAVSVLHQVFCLSGPLYFRQKAAWSWHDDQVRSPNNYSRDHTLPVHQWGCKGLGYTLDGFCLECLQSLAVYVNFDFGNFGELFQHCLAINPHYNDSEYSKFYQTDGTNFNVTDIGWGG